jgi:hypothetical protein
MVASTAVHRPEAPSSIEVAGNSGATTAVAVGIVVVAVSGWPSRRSLLVGLRVVLADEMEAWMVAARCMALRDLPRSKALGPGLLVCQPSCCSG